MVIYRSFIMFRGQELEILIKHEKKIIECNEIVKKGNRVQSSVKNIKNHKKSLITALFTRRL